MKVRVILLFYLSLTVSNLSFAFGEEELIAWWKFDEGKGKAALDSVSGEKDEILRNFWYIPGISGTAVKFDGFTTQIMRKAAKAPRLSEGFTIEGWIAPQAYPYNWCAIVNQQKEHKAGYFFGIDAFGRLGLHIAVDGKWYQCKTERKIPFMTKWSHIVGTFSKEEGITLYIDGEVAGKLKVRGKLTFANDIDLVIGRNHKKTLMDPKTLVRRGVNFPTSCSFDGLIDELKIYSRALSSDEIKRSFEKSNPKSAPALKWRKLPQIPKSNHFGATYAKLKFYPEWDGLWQVGDYPDIVINFDDSSYSMVFWRGTNYNMNLVTENGKWVGDQSAEGGGGEVIGCCEHMSDKQCRYAHVRVIENHDARVVVHWRYALCDVMYRIANLHDGWGAWADEYYYIYPDGVAVRYFIVYGLGGCSITEPAALNNPGERPEDNLNIDAVAMANMEGQVRSYSWDPWPSDGGIAAPFINALPNANICIVNFKSKAKPFYIYELGTRIIPYGGGLVEVRNYSKFPTWNHWPVSQVPSDGRYAYAADRVSSSAVTSPEPPFQRRPEDNAIEGRFIMGLTNQPIEKLSYLARSWLQPAEIIIKNGPFISKSFNRNQRAFILSRNNKNVAESLEFEIAASDNSPIVNPAFVIENWGDSDAGLKINGQTVKRGKDFRFGHCYRLEGSDLIVWVKIESRKPVKFELTPAGN